MRIKVQDPSANYLIGFAKNKLKSCMAARESLNEIIVKREYKTNGFTIECHAERDNNYIRITGGGFKGFLCHPRTFNGNGWDKSDATLPNGPYTFPLVDDDLGTRGIERKTEWVVSKKPENYGNLDWSGDGKVLSWRGPPGRHITLDTSLPIPGFTEWDYTELSGGLEIEHYTPYRNRVYQGGKLLNEFLYGYKVLGCGLLKNSLICVLGVDYAGKPNPDGGTGGFFEEVWIKAERIGWQQASRPNTPWFFNSIGTEAACGNKKLTVAGDFKSVAFSTLDAGSGTQTNEYNGTDRGSWGVTKAGSWPIFRDYVGLSEQHINLLLNFDEKSVLKSDGADTYSDLPVMISGTDNPVVTVTGPDAYGGEGAYSYIVTENHCGIDRVDWTYPTTNCGMGTVTATVTFKGGSAASGSMQVRMPIGIWIDDGVEYLDTDTSSAGVSTTIYAGEFRREYVRGNSLNLTTTYYTTLLPTSNIPSCPGCHSVSGCVSYSMGPGRDYIYTTPVQRNGTQTCCPGGVSGDSHLTYYKLYKIIRSKWVCP